MPLVKSHKNAHEKVKSTESHPLNRYFLEQEGNSDFPFTMALHALENLEGSTQNERDFYHYLLEDIVFSSLYATFMKQFFSPSKRILLLPSA